MLQATAIPTQHGDLVCDVAYDYYGERLSTASADQRVKVWRKDEQGKWQEEADWRAHDGPVTRLAWSHPEHGDLLASSSFDRSVKVWAESSGSGAARWQEKAFLSEAKGSVRAVEFAPNHFGLKLASISTDAHLRLYTSLSPLANDWQLTASVHLPALAPPETDAQRDDPRAGGAFGTPASALAGASSSTMQTAGSGASFANGSGGTGLGKNNEALGGWDLSFCREHWWGLLVAVSCGTSGGVTIVDIGAEPPVAVLALNPPQSGLATSQSARDTSHSNTAPSTASGPSAPITTLAWAPSCGRSYHLIATGSLDGTVRIWRVTPAEAAPADDDAMEESRAWGAEVRAEWGRGDAGVAKVEWNITGTVLSVASEDGRIRLFKMAYGGTWDCMGTFSAEAPAEGSDAGADDMQRE